MNSGSDRSNTVQLILGTGAFALCFAVLGSVSAMMPVLKRQFHLAPVQASISMAIPVLLGSLFRALSSLCLGQHELGVDQPGQRQQSDSQFHVFSWLFL